MIVQAISMPSSSFSTGPAVRRLRCQLIVARVVATFLIVLVFGLLNVTYLINPFSKFKDSATFTALFTPGVAVSLLYLSWNDKSPLPVTGIHSNPSTSVRFQLEILGSLFGKTLFWSTFISCALSNTVVHYLQYCVQLNSYESLLEIFKGYFLLVFVRSTVTDIIQWSFACLLLHSLLKWRIKRETHKLQSPTSEQLFSLSTLNQWNPLNSPTGVIYLFISLTTSIILRCVLEYVADILELSSTVFLETTIAHSFAELTGSIISSAAIFSLHQYWTDLRTRNLTTPDLLRFGSHGWWYVFENLFCLFCVFCNNMYLKSFVGEWTQHSVILVFTFYCWIFWPAARLGNFTTAVTLLVALVLNFENICTSGKSRTLYELQWVLVFNLCMCVSALLLSSSVRQIWELETGLQHVVQAKTKQLHQTVDELAQSSTVKSQFLSTMSHEIRTPMNGIIGMIELLRLTELSHEQKQYIEDVSVSSRHLLHIIDDILDFSKLEYGKMKLHESPTQIKTILDQALLLTRQQKYNHLSVTYNIAADVPPWLMVDAIRLKQILINLLSNALKFTDNGGVHIEVTQIPLSNEELSGYRDKMLSNTSINPESDNKIQCVKIQFCVADTGIGINSDQFPNLFHSFVQLEASPMREYGGTGLGLAICHRLVELMHGKIWLESTLGEGSKFYFTIMAFVSRELPVMKVVAEQIDINSSLVPGPSSTESSSKSSYTHHCVNIMVVHPIQDILLAFHQFQQLHHTNISFSTHIYSEAQNYIHQHYPLPADICIFDFTYAGADLIWDVVNEWKKSNIHLFGSTTAASSSFSSTPVIHIPALVLFCSHSHAYPPETNEGKQTDASIQKSMSLVIDQPEWSKQKRLISSLLNIGMLHVVHQPGIFPELFERLILEYSISSSRKQNPALIHQLIQIINEYSTTHLLNLQDNSEDTSGTSTQSVDNATTTSSPLSTAPATESEFGGILLVEDNLINQKVLVSMLKRLGYRDASILIAINGKEAVDMARYIRDEKRKFDIILMDIQMPVMSGIEAANQITKSYQQVPGSSAPIMIAVTATIMPSDKELYLSSGFVDYLPKPYSLQELRLLLQKWKK